MDYRKLAKVRHIPCSECPFNRKMTLTEVSQVLENFPNHHSSCEVLCHKDGFLDGNHYSNCYGFRASLRRLNLL